MVFTMLMPMTALAVSRPSAVDIPTGTLIIGTHIIALRSLTTQIYEIALQSAAKESQNSIYYRSEFADGKWCDITRAENIFNLTAVSGKPVEDSVIDSLVLTHFTMTDGKTYDLNSGGAVNPTDISSPYDASAIPSMEPLKTFADSLKSDQASDADKEKLALANRILEADYHTKETKELDKKLTAMGNYINYLHDKKATAQSIEIATELQQKLDNQRNSIIYSDVVQKTEAVANDAGKSYKERGALTDLVSILSDAKSTLDSEIQAFSSKALIRGTTIIDICVYEQSLQLISAAMARNFSGADKFLGIMVNIE
ncbi:MAG: hypothetical protein RRY40_03475, partial [Oscillospiraceae bacterium]